MSVSSIAGAGVGILDRAVPGSARMAVASITVRR
jgi:hypothetical protein